MKLTTTRLIAAAVTASSILAMTAPAFAHAATYAFVNSSQEVSTVTADNWMAALTNALNIDEHSGVLLLTAQNASIVGKSM
ncbi:MAG: hypothetical protein RLZZ26_192 [Candidatus Parcubacteria bacterium]|jgi:hypothetical protein